MDDHLLSIFQGELRTQCRFILVGARVVNVNLQQAGATDAIWFGLQGILTAASNASKMLWGSREEPVLEARRPLRESVGITDESPFSSRRIRNDFEHFDERLEAWFAASDDHIYVGRNIGPPNMIVIADRPPTDQFGHFDPATALVSFWERSANLSAIAAEAERILAQLDAIEQNRWRTPPPGH